jgi:KipI family sensor histidine kinase inhibitor
LSSPQPIPTLPVQIKIDRIAPAGDGAIVVELDASISREINKRVRDLEAALVGAGWPEIIATVPSYRSLLVYFDPVRVTFNELAQRIRNLGRDKTTASRKVRRWRLPVCYGGEYGPDLNDLAAKLNLSPEEAVREHSGIEYMVYLIGFSPGFAYLGELPKALEVPRKTTPRSLVAPNTIQIGGQQTAISSMPMPSGWYIVGRTPLKMYQPAHSKPFLLEGGDLIRFEPIIPPEFDSISAKVERGTFEASWEWVR